MVKVVISETAEGKIRMGTPDDLVKHGGSWSAAIGRIFQGEKEGLVMTLQYGDNDPEKLYLEEKS